MYLASILGQDQLFRTMIVILCPLDFSCGMPEQLHTLDENSDDASRLMPQDWYTQIFIP